MGNSNKMCAWALGREGNPDCQHQWVHKPITILVNPPLSHYECVKCKGRECRQHQPVQGVTFSRMAKMEGV